MVTVPDDPVRKKVAPYYRRLAEFERKIILAEFEATGGDLAQVARGLGLKRTTLTQKMKLLGIYMNEYERKLMYGKNAASKKIKAPVPNIGQEAASRGSIQMEEVRRDDSQHE